MSCAITKETHERDKSDPRTWQKTRTHTWFDALTPTISDLIDFLRDKKRNLRMSCVITKEIHERDKSDPRTWQKTRTHTWFDALTPAISDLIDFLRDDKRALTYVLCDQKRDPRTWQKWPTNTLDRFLARRQKSPYICYKRGVRMWQKRDLHIHQKRPTCVTKKRHIHPIWCADAHDLKRKIFIKSCATIKETCTCDKRDLRTWQKRHTWQNPSHTHPIWCADHPWSK